MFVFILHICTTKFLAFLFHSSVLSFVHLFHIAFCLSDKDYNLHIHNLYAQAYVLKCSYPCEHVNE